MIFGISIPSTPNFCHRSNICSLVKQINVAKLGAKLEDILKSLFSCRCCPAILCGESTFVTVARAGDGRREKNCLSPRAHKNGRRVASTSRDDYTEAEFCCKILFAVVDFLVPKRCESPFLPEQLSASAVYCCFMEEGVAAFGVTNHDEQAWKNVR